MGLLLQLFGRRVLAKAAAIGLGIIALEYIGIGLILPFVTVATNPATVSRSRVLTRLYDAGGFASHQRFVTALAGLFLALFVGKSVLTYLLQRWNAGLTMAANRDLASRLIRQTLEADYRVFIERSPSVFVGTMRGHTHYATLALSAMVAMITEGVLLLLLFALALWLKPRVTLALAGILIVLGLVMKRLIVDRMQRFGRERNEINAHWEHLTFGVISSIRDIKIMGFEKQLERQFDAVISRYTASTARYLSLQAAPRLIGELLVVQLVVGCVCFFHVRQVDLAANLPVLATFTVVLMRMVPSVHKIYNSLGHYKYCYASIQEIRDVALYLGRNDRAVRDAVSPFTRAIRFEHVGFSYQGATRPALLDVTVTIPKNGFIGVVGRSGSGKSTFLDVLSGLLRADGGRILLDDREVDPFATTVIRRFVGYVPQQVTLLDESIGYNISLDPDYRDHLGRVEAAARAAHIDEFVAALPGRFDAPAGEGGVKMSGGQRQRIGIARALYKNPDILLFDEATSAVDTITEQQIMQSVLELSKAKTVLFATHRLQTVETCDLILVFDAGRLVDLGTHRDLKQRCSVYRSLFHSVAAEQADG